MDLKKLTPAETEAYLRDNMHDLVFCGQNEFARFGANTNRRFGGTDGMDSCSAAFFWNKKTKEACVSHTHNGTDWAKTKKLFFDLCQDEGWEITAASGKYKGAAAAWLSLERITQELEAETGGRVKANTTLHPIPGKPTNFGDHRDYIYSTNTYCMDSHSGQIVSLDEATYCDYCSRPEYRDTLDNNPCGFIANGYQYISRDGTVPVCSFDGKEYTYAKPVLDNNPESIRALQECERIFIEQIIKHGDGMLEAFSRQPAESTGHKDLLDKLRDSINARSHKEIEDFIASRHSLILKPILYTDAKAHISIYAKMVINCLWQSFSEMAEKAAAQYQGCHRPNPVTSAAQMRSLGRS